MSRPVHSYPFYMEFRHVCAFFCNTSALYYIRRALQGLFAQRCFFYRCALHSRFTCVHLQSRSTFVLLHSRPTCVHLHSRSTCVLLPSRFGLYCPRNEICEAVKGASVPHPPSLPPKKCLDLWMTKSCNYSKVLKKVVILNGSLKLVLSVDVSKFTTARELIAKLADRLECSLDEIRIWPETEYDDFLKRTFSFFPALRSHDHVTNICVML